MAVLKFLVSAALLGTVAQCQYSPYGSIRSGTSEAQYSPSVLTRGTPRLVPVSQVRGSASRLFPSFYYPAYPPPVLPLFSRHQALNHRPYSSSGTTSSGIHRSPTFPRLHQQYRPSMTGYYRPNRQSYFGNPFRESGQQQLTYQAAAATAAPIVLKRGRVLAASSSSPYAIQSFGSAGAAYPYTQSIPGVSTYRAPPQAAAAPQSQPQIAASPIDTSALFQQQLQQIQQQQLSQQQYSNNQGNQQRQENYQQQHGLQPQIQHQYQAPQIPQIQQTPQFTYVQKSPAVVTGPLGRPLKKVAKKPVPRPTAETEEEEYPGDPNPQYNFSFDIKDDELTNYQNRQEERDGQTIKGSYSVVDPDGYVRTVTYTADPKNGFQAKVTREPTDVKIKFPVPTEAPPADQSLKNAGPRRAQQSYASPQVQYQQQPQYQTAAYATPQQVYTSTAGEAGVVPQQYVQRAASRFAIQGQASAPQPRIVSRTSYTQPQPQQQAQEEQ